MAYHRGAVLTGQSITLRITFTDDANNLINTDSLPDIYIYDESVDAEVIDAEVLAKVYTTALAGPLTPALLSTGYYELVYTVPSSSAEGSWHDLWVGLIDGADVDQYFTFTVTQGADLSTQAIGDNTMIVVQLDDTITNLAGNQNLVASSLYYTTVYNPLYASPDLVRMELGRWIDWIPDDTLALMIHWASKEADFIHGARENKWGNLELARTKFVIYDSALKALMIPGQGLAAGYSSGKSKMLGDLSIKDGKPVTQIEKEILDSLRSARDDWWRIVNAGGNIVQGQGFTPTFAVKGAFDPDRRNTGRLWESPRAYHYPQPSANRKLRRQGRRRGRFGFTDDGRR